MPDLARWTREAVADFPDDGKRYELFDGQLLVTPSPGWRHQGAVSLLMRRFLNYLDDSPIGRILTSPADLLLDGDQLAQPDLFVLPGRALSGAWADAPLPLLVIEILSPSTARYDRGLKRRIYQRVGVPEYWIVDLDARMVERWRPEDERPEIVDAELTWQSGAGTEPLTIDLAALFAELDA